nr:MAG TPA: hypothetical protein [Caudoviricetes sp.]
MISEANYRELQKYLLPHHPSKEEYERFVELNHKKLIKAKDWKTVSVPGYVNVPVQDTFIITEAGKDALAEFEEYQDTRGKQLEAIQNIADSAVRRANLAESEALSAKKDAKFSKALSILSIVVGFGSLIVAILALVLR